MNKSKIFLAILYVILIAGFAYLIISSGGFGLWGKKESKEESKTGDWQAVFLTNGQVYFGKLDGLSKDFVKLREIYYLQLAQAPQPQEGKQQQQPPKASLVKLGNELHGPEDQMIINRDQILFVEDMKPESKVVEAINRYKTQGPDQTDTQNQPSTQQQKEETSTESTKTESSGTQNQSGEGF